MDVQQAKAAQREMEDSIQAAIHDAMTVFRAKTGLYPRSIEVRMVEITLMGDRERTFAVGEVTADVRL